MRLPVDLSRDRLVVYTWTLHRETCPSIRHLALSDMAERYLLNPHASKWRSACRLCNPEAENVKPTP